MASKGSKLSAETRAKISASKKGQISWKKGKIGIYSPETLAKMSASVWEKT
ncbi:MAG: NUMOD3 domain-containing DNA-binding protein [Candidatus Nitrosotenuis sp.]